MHPPASGETWIALGDSPLPVGDVYQWCVHPTCGAVVVFSGTVRDHALDDTGALRSGVGSLTYEAYEEHAEPRLSAVVDELRRRWPDAVRVAVLHRTGRIDLGESSVVVAVGAPHRAEAFEAARFAIDAVKATAPIWKHEEWEGGAGWGTGAHDAVISAEVPTAQSASA